MGAQRLSILTFAAVLAASLVARQLAGGLGDRIPAGHVGVNTAAYTGRIAGNIVRLGHAESEWGAPFAVVPTEPSRIEHYDRHPFLYWHWYALLLKLTGLSPRALQLVAALGLIPLAWALVGLGRSVGPRATSFFAAALALGTPIMAHYGHMAGTHLAVVMWAAVALWARPSILPHGTAGRGKASVFAAALFLGCMLDWWGYMLALALLVDVFLFERRRGRTLLWIVVPTGLAGVLTFLSFAHTLNGFEAAFHHMLSLGSESRTDSSVVGVGDGAWWVRLVEFSLAGFGWAALSICAAGVSVAVCRLDGGRLRLLLLAGLFGLGNHVILSRYAYTHPYWALFWVPFVVVGAASAFEFAMARIRFGALLLVAVVLGVAASGIQRATVTLQTELAVAAAIPQETAVDLINRIAGPSDMVFTNISTSLLALELVPSFALGPITTTIELAAVMERYMREPIAAPGRVLFILAMLPGHEQLKGALVPPLAEALSSPLPGILHVFALNP